MMAVFHWDGTQDCWIDSEKTCAMGLLKHAAPRRKNQDGMSSEPVDVALRESRMWNTVCSVIIRCGEIDWQEALRDGAV